MKNFVKAFLFFLCWASAALVIQGPDFKKDVSKRNTKNTSIKENKETTQTLKSILKKNNKNTAHLKIKQEIHPLKFKHKFVTNASHTRVLFPEQFFYFKDSIFNFLNNNPKKEILIVGHCLPDELLSNNTNFGQKRADYIKNKLIKHGINPEKLNTKDSIISYNYDHDGFYAEGIDLFYVELSKEKMTSLYSKLSPKTIQNSFVRNNKLILNNQLRTYAFELKDFLTSNPNKVVNIIGHSNKNSDSEISNSIGLELAQQFASFLKEIGIVKSKLKIISKGDIEAFKNKTTTNKRIEIIIN
ncbi:hypothetical protein [Tenacibaculum sp. C7A-26P2]|uniref:hypothetical protein n=1 Tax=Tenacibaculum sp. C7A-26P2 TaxID=3447504 RepID=UPI003F83516B